MIDDQELQRMKEIEYEYLYNLRDQAVLYLRMSQSNLGYVSELYTLVDEMVRNLRRDLEKE